MSYRLSSPRFALAALVLAALSLAGRASVRVLIADQLAQDDEAELRRAVALTPRNADAWARLGSMLEKRGDDARAAEVLQRAVELNRYDSGAWVDLALVKEIGGDMPGAQKCLLEAVRVDSTFPPWWALANFHLRAGNTDPFWSAMRRAVASGRADLDAAFALYWRASEDPAEILRRGIPDVPEVNRKYLAFLLQTDRNAACDAVWDRQSARLQPEDLPAGLSYVDRLIASRSVPRAVKVWNQLCAAGLVRFQPLDPAAGRLLTGGDFASEPSGRSFDWALRATDGLTAYPENLGGLAGLRIRFSGAHPESTEILAQFAPALDRRTYRLKYQYATEGLEADTGLYWTVEDVTAGQNLATVLATTPPLQASEGDGSHGRISFQTGPGTRLLRLVLAYHRSPGTTRARGSISLSGVDLQPAEPGVTHPRAGRSLP